MRIVLLLIIIVAVPLMYWSTVSIKLLSAHAQQDGLDIRVVVEEAFAAGFANGSVWQKLGAPDLDACKRNLNGGMDMEACSKAILAYSQKLTRGQ